MKIYLIKLIEHDYDEYDSWIVIAKNRDNVAKIVGCDKHKEELKKGIYSGRNEYLENIESITYIGETKIKEEQILLGSFNAG